tara:strand:+ start:362 stop:787 length:426 start_codon:yes stop_codon:yes gene_type:complete
MGVPSPTAGFNPRVQAGTMLRRVLAAMPEEAKSGLVYRNRLSAPGETSCSHSWWALDAAAEAGLAEAAGASTVAAVEASVAMLRTKTRNAAAAMRHLAEQGHTHCPECKINIPDPNLTDFEARVAAMQQAGCEQCGVCHCV